MGRFVQPDSIIPDPGKAKAYDRYAYVENSPINYNDPSGHFPWPILWLAIWVVLNVPGDVGPYSTTPGNEAIGDLPLRMASDPYDIFRTAMDCINGECNAVDVFSAALPLVPGGLSKINKSFSLTENFAKIPGIETLTGKFLSKSNDVVIGAIGELEYLMKHEDEIEEIGRSLEIINGGNKEIDFVLKGNIFVNVKNYNWAKISPKVLDYVINNMVKEAVSFRKYNPNGIKYVFKGSVPNSVRQALENKGIIVDVMK